MLITAQRAADSAIADGRNTANGLPRARGKADRDRIKDIPRSLVCEPEIKTLRQQRSSLVRAK